MTTAHPSLLTGTHPLPYTPVKSTPSTACWYIDYTIVNPHEHHPHYRVSARTHNRMSNICRFRNPDILEENEKISTKKKLKKCRPSVQE